MILTERIVKKEVYDSLMKSYNDAHPRVLAKLLADPAEQPYIGTMYPGYHEAIAHYDAWNKYGPGREETMFSEWALRKARESGLREVSDCGCHDNLTIELLGPFQNENGDYRMRAYLSIDD